MGVLVEIIVHKGHDISSYHPEECDRTGREAGRLVCISVSYRNLELSRKAWEEG